MIRQAEHPAERYDILVISEDVVGEKMAGPGIRAWELTRVLAREFKVILGVPDYSPGQKDDPFFDHLPFRVFHYAVGDSRLMESIGEKSRIILLQGYTLDKFPVIKKLKSALIVDLYVPFVLENMFVHQWKVPNLRDREFIHRNDLRVFLDLLLSGDHFLCANHRQKDLFLGSLLALNRIRPGALEDNPALDNLISVVPFGLSEEIEGLAPADRGESAGFPFPIGADDILFLWGGVISNWFDPLTLIKALAQAVRKNDRLKLLFLSTGHPNPLLPEFDMAGRAVRLAADLGLQGRHVFFNPDWVPYHERGAFFRRADVGVSIHKINFETYYAFRTRMLDYLKYGLPILCTEGDFFAELVAREKIGLTVPAEDVDALEAAILKLAEDGDLRKASRARLGVIRPSFEWQKVAEPLCRYCRRVLAGPPIQSTRLSGEDARALFRPRKSGLFRRLVQNRHLWPALQRLPTRVSVKLKRLWK
jgi:glycosyltransferase involved in cell wall biosynthesis